MNSLVKIFFFVGCITWFAASGNAVPTTLNDFFLPGSQPGQSGQLQTPDKCDNCHGGYNLAVEPAFTWRGGMMAQAARDPIFWACVAIANQDAPQSGDLCIRCHSPSGWLEGRSIPTDGSALNANDREGVQCDFCHKLVKPSALGVNPYPSNSAYTSGTYPRDQTYLAILNPIPPASANGMYIADVDNAKRGPFTDAEARHQQYYSPFHQDANLCGTCHNVSNPVYSWDPVAGEYLPNAFDAAAPNFDPYSQFPVERTFGEWTQSAYNTPQGIYAPQFGGNRQYVSTCQDCHMRDVTGVGCNKAGAPVRNDLPLHDLTGGNTFMPALVAALYPSEVNTAALNAGILRAREMLSKAATLAVEVVPSGGAYQANVRVTNETGHKLPSGYPEGRRVWLNVKAFDAANALVYESGNYNPATAVLTHDPDLKIYEIHLGISESIAGAVGLPAGVSFHFVLNNQVYFDNRIPPRGFTNANFAAIQSPVVGYTYPDGQYWDDSIYPIPATATRVVTMLYYQTVSKEYADFLLDENHTNNAGSVFHNLWAANGKSTPEVMAQREVFIGGYSDNQAPTAPTNLTAQAVSSSQINLAWTASTDNVAVTGYYVYRNNVQIATVTGTTFQNTGLQQRTTYSYFVKARDAAGNISAPSNTASATTPRRTGGGGGGAAPPGGGPGEVAVVIEPNPFNAVAQITYTLPAGANVRLEMFNLMGQRVATLTDAMMPAGVHIVQWSPNGLGSGIYILRLDVDSETILRKVTLLK